MKRRVIQLVLLLFAGAIVNVAVAWGCAYWLDPVAFKRDGKCFGSTRTERQLDEYPRKIRETIALREGPPDPAKWHVVRRRYALWIDSHGLPLQTMCASAYVSPFWHMNGPATVAGPLCDVQTDGIPLRMDFLTSMLVCTWQLPLQPLWPGFAINTIFYAAMLWVVFFVPGKLKRMLRRRRGLCPACAYPVGTSEVCTECGAALPRNVKTSGHPLGNSQRLNIETI